MWVFDLEIVYIFYLSYVKLMCYLVMLILFGYIEGILD